MSSVLGKLYDLENKLSLICVDPSFFLFYVSINNISNKSPLFSIMIS